MVFLDHFEGFILFSSTFVLILFQFEALLKVLVSSSLIIVIILTYY
jgi:hypothetical protein